MKHFSLALIFLCLAWLAGCSQTTDGSKALAQVDGDAVTEKDYELYLKMRHARQTPVADKAKEKEVVLNEMVDRILLARRARELKLDKDTESRFLLKRMEENILIQALVKNIAGESTIGDEDLRKRFTSELESLHKNEYKVSHILLTSESDAKDVIARIKKGAAFAQLARQKSIDKESGKNGGELGWVRQDMVVPEFFAAVTALKKGATSEAPAKSEFGYHIVRVHDSRALKVPSVDELLSNPRAKEDMTRRLRDERVQALVKELRGKTKIKID